MTAKPAAAVNREGGRAFDGSIVELWTDGGSGVRRPSIHRPMTLKFTE